MIAVPVLALLAALVVSSLDVPSTSDAYLWQREVDVAVVDDFAAFSSGRLHVLAFDEMPASSGTPAPGRKPFEQRDRRLLEALARSGVPVVVTARVQTLRPLDGTFQRLIDSFAAGGVDVVGLEIDHDCASARLPAYAAWLPGVRAEAGVPLSVTALPTWLKAPGWRAVVAAVDEVTLQLHAIRAPALFDVDDALGIIAAWPDLRVALPTYGVTLRGGDRVFADPVDVVKVRAAASRVSWFRWPAPGDRSAWDLKTLAIVDDAVGLDASQSLHPGLALTQEKQTDGTVAIHVKNTGDVAVPFPALFMGGDLARDTFAGFIVDDRGAIAPTSARFLHPGDDVVVGWARPLARGGLGVALLPD
ncbi:MAG: DUF3142 domain-containing protein [Deltaproteobacteria bacterium]|nr:DUF3142 domain-containing protein [Deltaproteobacteria bacterium]